MKTSTVGRCNQILYVIKSAKLRTFTVKVKVSK